MTSKAQTQTPFFTSLIILFCFVGVSAMGLLLYLLVALQVVRSHQHHNGAVHGKPIPSHAMGRNRYYLSQNYKRQGERARSIRERVWNEKFTPNP